MSITPVREEAPVIVHGTEKKIGVTTDEQEKHIKELKHRIIAYRKMTDFDRILLAVNVRGVVTAPQLQKELNLEEKHFMECVTILQRNGDIKVEYPFVGPMRLVRVEKKKSEEWI